MRTTEVERLERELKRAERRRDEAESDVAAVVLELADAEAAAATEQRDETAEVEP